MRAFTFRASFKIHHRVVTDYSLYSASIRASAKVVRLLPHVNNETDEELVDFFGLGRLDGDAREPEPLIFGSDGVTDVTFELLTGSSKCWIELGCSLLLMPGVLD